MDELIGTRLGAYEIIEKVGEGGMAAVFRAHQPSMNRDVAIKVMSNEVSEYVVFVARFRNEAQVIARLEHAHILPVHDYGEQNGTFYIVMRYLPEGDLGDLIAEGAMETGRAIQVFKQIATAMDYAHSSGIVHRDLKPSNVLIDSQGNAFLTDFGIAKVLGSTDNLTQTNTIMGTPTYMAPEQGLGQPIDGRADIYSLGCMLFEMLPGQPPFESEHAMSLMLRHLNDPAPKPTDINPSLPKQLDSVVLKAIAKEPEDRYQSALEMAEALERAYAIARGMTPPPDTGKKRTPTAALAKGADALNLEAVIQDTVSSPVKPAGQTETGGPPDTIPNPTPPAQPTPAAAVAGPHLTLDVSVTLNPVSAWLHDHPAVGTWLQAISLSVMTFVLLNRLTTDAAPEIALLSLFPGVLLYGLLNAPIVGALISFGLVLVPLLAVAPGLGLIWAAVMLVVGARLTSREALIILLGTVLAGTPLGLALPLFAGWWFRARQAALSSAVGVLLATLFAVTLGWPAANGLLPVPDGPPLSRLVVAVEPETPGLEPYERTVLIRDGCDTTFIGLIDPAVWETWLVDPLRAADSIGFTVALLGEYLEQTGALALIIAAGWGLSAVVAVSNRRTESPLLRAAGMGLALLILLVVHVGFNPEPVDPAAVGLLLVGTALVFALTQLPIQADPNSGNRAGTVLRMLRQSLGAFFAALGVAFFLPLLVAAGIPRLDIVGIPVDIYQLTWIGAVFGVLSIITNPLIGAPLVFTALIISIVLIQPVTAGLVGGLFILYLLVNLVFDRQRPRRWNPLGAGMMLGSPGMAATGLLPLGPLSTGALESQLPAAMFASASYMMIVAGAALVGETIPTALALLHIAATMAGVLTVERLMESELLADTDNKLRRLIFTSAAGLLLALLYYVPDLFEVPLFAAVIVSTAASAALVLAMGERARYWRRFVEQADSDEEDDDFLEDEEVTGLRERRRRERARGS
ncbi:MAG: serine/threonine-protein kinase [Anaerolineae bacterium]